MIRSLASDFIIRFACAWYDTCVSLSRRIESAGHAGLHVSHELRAWVDRDEEPCVECGDPGGTHEDCDAPELGRLTRTERLEAFGDA